MADNWSASPLTLTDAGDWAKWEITLSSTEADNLNNPTNDFLNDISLRMAMSAANRLGHHALIINDVVSPNNASWESDASTAGWVSANRFGLGQFGGVTGAAVIDFPGGGPGTPVAVDPWVAGVNTIRLLYLGRDSDGAAEPLEIDFLSVQSDATGTGPFIHTHWGFGTDSADDPKPITGPSAVGYDDHVDPDPVGTGSGDPATWILEGSEADTGTAGDSLLHVVHFCPPVAKVRVTGAGSPVAGLVGVHESGFGGVTDVQTLDATGRATFTVTGVAPFAHFWYGGNDDWAPDHTAVDSDDRIGCDSGWHVGRIGVG